MFNAVLPGEVQRVIKYQLGSFETNTVLVLVRVIFCVVPRKHTLPLICGYKIVVTFNFSRKLSEANFAALDRRTGTKSAPLGHSQNNTPKSIAALLFDSRQRYLVYHQVKDVSVAGITARHPSRTAPLNRTTPDGIIQQGPV